MRATCFAQSCFRVASRLLKKIIKKKLGRLGRPLRPGAGTVLCTIVFNSRKKNKAERKERDNKEKEARKQRKRKRGKGKNEKEGRTSKERDSKKARKQEKKEKTRIRKH